jgi:hypothetical protein
MNTWVTRGTAPGLVLAVLAVLTLSTSCSQSSSSGSTENPRLVGSTTSALSGPQTLLARGTTWLYWDNPTATTLSTTASEPAIAASAPPLDGTRTWKDKLYDAQPRSAESPNGWASGSAILGYGAPAPVTRLRCDPANAVCPTTPPSNKFVSYYFRTTVNVAAADLANYATFTLRVLRDDAAVVYVNGVERGRSPNLPQAPAAIGYGTVATSSIGTASWSGTGVDTFNLEPSAFVAGDNVIAVELHQQSATSSDVAFDAELIGAPLGVTRGPFLQQGTPTSTVIRWRTNAANIGRVSVGTSPGVFTATFDEAAAAPSPFDHEIHLTGLTPGTRYYYSVGTADGALAGGDADHFFRTSPDPTGPSPALRIWAFGDSGRANDGQRAVRDAFLPVHAARPADLFIMLGDNAYETGRDDEYQSEVFDIYPSLLRSLYLWPTHGNHETSQSHVEANVLASPFFNIFTLPKGAEAGGVPSGTERYYSWNWGNVHFISLDPQTTTTESNTSLRTYPDSVPPGAPVGTLPGMLTWLTADLQANTRRWTIAYSHHPPYTKGTHNSDSSSDYESAMLRKYVLPRLEQYGVDLMLSGHSHAYERSRLISGHHGGLDADGGLSLADSPSTTFDASAHVVPQANGTVLGRPEVDGPYLKSTGQGTIYAVVGTGGDVGSGSLNHPAMVTSFSKLGSMIIDIDGDRLDAKFLQTDGSLGDSFTVIKGASTNPLPTVSITSPASGTAAVNGTMTVTAAASDADGISQVTFFKNLVPVATVTAPPYEATLTGLFGNGSVQVIAEATDALGARAGSVPVNVTLTSPPPGTPTGLTATALSDAPGQISLSWTDPDNLEQGFEIERSTGDTSSFVSIGRINNPSGTLPATRTFVDSGLDPSVTYFYRVRGFANTVYGPYSNTASATSVAGTPLTLVRSDSIWSYLDNDSSPLSWASPTFDDSAWPKALAELGYGDGDEETTVGFGPNANAKYVTTYFRRRFTVVDANAYPALTSRLLRDDGAVVYLNGIEVFRSNMPAGSIDHGTFASSSAGGSAETTWFSQAVDPALLVAGENVLAVEVHQSDLSSTDLSFSLELVSAASALVPGAPLGLVAVGVSTSQIDLSWTKNSTTETGFQIERSTDQSATWTLVTVTPKGASTYSDMGLSASTQYAYRVSAVSPSGSSAAVTATARTCDLETCDGLDNDCDGVVDNTYDVGDLCSVGVGQCAAAGLKACSGPDMTACTATPLPASTELCDDLDNDCDGTTDDDFPTKGAACSAGIGACNRDGVQVCTSDGASTVCNAVPGAPVSETCDAIDNDCDGSIDDGTGRGDACAVGVGECERSGTQVCSADGGVVCDAVPGAPVAETCDDVDNDCDGSIDNGTGKGDVCTLGVGTCARLGSYVCNSSGGLLCDAVPGAPSAELCDGEDNDCDSAIDEDFGVGTFCTVIAGGCISTGTRVCAGATGTACQLAPQTCQTDVFLHGETTGPRPGRRNDVLTLDHDAPSRSFASVESSGALNRNRGNPWKKIGTWTAEPDVFVGTITALAGKHLWVRNDDHRSLEFDLKVEVFRNGVLLTSGERRCLSLPHRSPSDVQVPLAPFNPVAFDGTDDDLTYEVSARMGTTARGSACGGRWNNASDGASVYFDSTGLSSSFTAVVAP